MKRKKIATTRTNNDLIKQWKAIVQMHKEPKNTRPKHLTKQIYQGVWLHVIASFNYIITKERKIYATRERKTFEKKRLNARYCLNGDERKINDEINERLRWLGKSKADRTVTRRNKNEIFRRVANKQICELKAILSSIGEGGVLPS